MVIKQYKKKILVSNRQFWHIKNNKLENQVMQGAQKIQKDYNVSGYTYRTNTGLNWHAMEVFMMYWTSKELTDNNMFLRQTDYSVEEPDKLTKIVFH